MMSRKLNIVRTNIFLKNNTSIFVLAFQIADSPVLSNASTHQSSSFDDITHTPPSTLRNTESLTTEKTDDQQSETQLTINKKFSRPKILAEDVQSK
jgi:hypothetical protein